METQSHNCAGCPNTDKCREVWAEANNGPLTAHGLVIFSIVAFLFPIFMAIIGGAAATSLKCSDLWVMISSGGSFLFAAAIAAFLVHIFKKYFLKSECNKKS